MDAHGTNSTRQQMSKKHNQPAAQPPSKAVEVPVVTSQTSTPAPTVLPASVDPEPDIVRTPSGRMMEQHRRCPLCWNRCQGYGTSYSTAPNGRTYYKCKQTLSTDHPPCAHTWSVVVSLHSVTVQHRTVRLDGER